MDQKEKEAAKAAADAEDAKITVTDSDIKGVEDKLLTFASQLSAGERKHLFSVLDQNKGPEEGADVQGYWWWDSWRSRYWHREHERDRGFRR